MSEWHLKADSLRIDDIDGGDGFVVVLPPADEEGVFLTAPKPTYPWLGGTIAIGARINGADDEDIVWADEYGILNIEVEGGGGGGGVYTSSNGIKQLVNDFRLLDTLPGAGVEIMWIPAKYAFRAGQVTGTEWAAANIGNHSVATGYNTIASNAYTIAHGRACQSTGYYAMAFGSGAISSGIASVAMGTLVSAEAYAATAFGGDTHATGICSTVVGWESYASGEMSLAWGDNIYAEHYTGAAFGRFNDRTGLISPTVFDLEGKVFQIGIGLNDASRANAFELKYSGAAKLNQYGTGDFTGTHSYSLAVDANGNLIEVDVVNGLNVSGGNIKLGGPLTENTVVTGATAYSLDFLQLANFSTQTAFIDDGDAIHYGHSRIGGDAWSLQGKSQYGLFSDFSNTVSANFEAGVDTHTTAHFRTFISVGPTEVAYTMLTQTKYEMNAPQTYLKSLPTYADDTAAGVGGLTTDRVYKTATGVLMAKL